MDNRCRGQTKSGVRCGNNIYCRYHNNDIEHAQIAGGGASSQLSVHDKLQQLMRNVFSEVEFNESMMDTDQYKSFLSERGIINAMRNKASYKTINILLNESENINMDDIFDSDYVFNNRDYTDIFMSKNVFKTINELLHRVTILYKITPEYTSYLIHEHNLSQFWKTYIYTDIINRGEENLAIYMLEGYGAIYDDIDIKELHKMKLHELMELLKRGADPNKNGLYKLIINKIIIAYRDNYSLADNATEEEIEIKNTNINNTQIMMEELAGYLIDSGANIAKIAAAAILQQTYIFARALFDKTKGPEDEYNNIATETLKILAQNTSTTKYQIDFVLYNGAVVIDSMIENAPTDIIKNVFTDYGYKLNKNVFTD